MNNLMILPAQNLDAEQSLIASLILDNKFFKDCDYLYPCDFYKTVHQKIYAACQDMYRAETPVDLTTLATELEKRNQLEEIGGAFYLVKITETSAVFNVQQYVKSIKEAALTREIKHKCASIVGSEMAGEDLLSLAQSDVLNIKSTNREDAIHAFKDIIPKHLDRIEYTNSTKEGVYYKTGFPGLDKALKLKFGKLIIIAGRPGMGKTSFAVTVSRNLDKQGLSVGFLNIEMPEEETIDRWISQESCVDSSKIGQYKGLDKKEIQAISDAAAVLYDSNIKIDSTGSVDIVDVERKCRKLVADGVQVILIDQLSQIGNRQIKAGEKTALFTENCTRIARLKKELGVPIILLAQLRRPIPGTTPKEPILSDLKQSGQIEEDADAVIFIHRPEEYATTNSDREALKGITILSMPKNRHGPKYRSELIRFNHETTYFYQTMQ